MGHVFLGITIVGIVMTIKIIFDGLSTVRINRGKIMAARGSIVMARNMTDKAKASSDELAKEVAAAKKEVEALVKKETEIGTQIRELQAELDKDQYY